ncbi:MAG: calcium-binding protein [Halorhodospira sp.]
MSVDQHEELSEAENAGDATIALEYNDSGLETDGLDGVGSYLFDPQSDSNSLTFTMVDGGTNLGIMTDASDGAVTIDLDGQTATGTWGSEAHSDANDFRGGTDVLNASSGGDIAGVNDGSDIGGIEDVHFEGSDVTLTITADQYDELTDGTVSEAGSATIDFADAVSTGDTIDDVGTWELYADESNEFALGTGGQEVYYGDSGDDVTVGEGDDVLHLGDGDDSIIFAATNATQVSEEGDNEINGFDDAGSDVVEFTQDLATAATGGDTGAGLASELFNEVSQGDTDLTVTDNAVWQVSGEFSGAGSAGDVADWMTGAISDGDLSSGDQALFAFNDGSDTYLWHLEAADGTATNIGEGDLELIGQFNEKQEFSHDDFAVA